MQATHAFTLLIDLQPRRVYRIVKGIPFLIAKRLLQIPMLKSRRHPVDLAVW